MITLYNTLGKVGNSTKFRSRTLNIEDEFGDVVMRAGDIIKMCVKQI